MTDEEYTKWCQEKWNGQDKQTKERFRAGVEGAKDAIEYLEESLLGTMGAGFAIRESIEKLKTFLGEK